MCNLVDEAYGQAIREYEHYESTVTDIDELKQAVSDVIDDDSGEFGKALVSHFPVEDKMPTFSDVREYMDSWRNTDSDDEEVDLVCMLMELHYDIDWCQRCNDSDSALVETDYGLLCDRCARQSVGLPIA